MNASILTMIALVAYGESTETSVVRFPYMPDFVVVGCPMEVMTTGDFREPAGTLKEQPRRKIGIPAPEWHASIVRRYGDASAILRTRDCASDDQVLVYAQDASAIDARALANMNVRPSPYCDGTPIDQKDSVAEAALSLVVPKGRAYYVILSGPITGGRSERITSIDWDMLAKKRSWNISNRKCGHVHD